MTVGTTQLAPGNGHNYVINGAFDFWQRGDSFAATTSTGFTADRWFRRNSGATVAVNKRDFTGAELNAIGFGDAKHYLEFDITVGNAEAGFLYKIEDVQTLAGQDVTLSFYAKASTSMTWQARLTQEFASDTNNNTAYQALSVTTSWQRFELNYSLSSLSGKTISDSDTLQIFLNEVNGDTGTFDLWGVQLEAGSVATPFKRHAPSLQGELAACQRYYQILRRGSLIGRQDNNGVGYLTGPISPDMRTSPSIAILSSSSNVLVNGEAFYDATINSSLSTPNSVQVNFNYVAGAPATDALLTLGSSGNIVLSAEIT